MKEDVRIYINDHPRYRAAGQIARAGDGEVYEEDKTGKRIDACIRSAREDRRSIVQVDELFLLSIVKGRPAARKRILAERIAKVKKKRCVIRERSSGLRSDQPGFEAAVIRAAEMIGNGGRGAPGKPKKGRPLKARDEATLAIMRADWFSREHGTIADVFAALKAKKIENVTRAELYKFGPRG